MSRSRVRIPIEAIAEHSVARDGETVAVRVEKETKMRVPVHNLGGIVCFGRVGCSPALMGMCAERGVAISFFNRRGRFWARVQGPVSGNVLLRREQYRRAQEPEECVAIARASVVAKVTNSRNVLLRSVRDHPDATGSEEVTEAARRLLIALKALARDSPLDTIRGHEGDAARTYFSVFDHLIVANKAGFTFSRRSRRPPLDRVNALLSFLYSMLAHDVAAALEGVGLDPAVGFLHRDRPGRPGLALDLMEELRPCLADRLVLSLVNRQQVSSDGFTQSESSAVMMDDDTRKTVIGAYQDRKAEEIQHPFTGEKIPIGLIAHVQAMLLSRHLRGDLDGYPPYVWK